jgi:transposase-like protein
VHQIRSSTRYVSYKHKKEFIKDLKLVYKADTLELAEDALLKLDEKRGKVYPQSVKSWVSNRDELSAYFAYSKAIRKLIYTTNPIESFNRQLRTATKKITVFPNDMSLNKRLYLASKNAKKKRMNPLSNR